MIEATYFDYEKVRRTMRTAIASNFLQDLICWSSLKNWTTNNTRQHDTTRVEHGTTRVEHEATRDGTSTMRHNTSTARPNTSTKEARAAKTGLYILLFVTELYISLISF